MFRFETVSVWDFDVLMVFGDVWHESSLGVDLGSTESLKNEKATRISDRKKQQEQGV